MKNNLKSLNIMNIMRNYSKFEINCFYEKMFPFCDLSFLFYRYRGTQGSG